MKLLKATIIIAFAVCSASTINAEGDDTIVPRIVQPAKIFGSHMVLQRRKPITIWGTAEKREKVTVILGKKSLIATTDDHGNWAVTFPAQEASKDPTTLKINETLFADILIGDVWLCSGQSNMAFSLSGAQVGKDKANELSDSDLRIIQFGSIKLSAKNGYSQAELARCNSRDLFQGTWYRNGSKKTFSTSAVAWFFGSKLQKELNIPVGIIIVSVGGSAINNWISPEQLKNDPATAGLFTKDYLTNPDVYINHRKRAKASFKHVLEPGKPYLVGKTKYRWMCEPGFLYEAGIAPLKSLGISGIIWYQGESDTNNTKTINNYATLLPMMVDGWRKQFNNPDCPFLFVQLPQFNKSSWPLFREVQRLSEKKIPHSAMVSTIDLGAEKNIHPKDKQPVGERLSRLAMKHAYGKKDIVGFPIINGIKRDGNKLIVKFRECGSGFLSVKGNVCGFEVSDKAGVFHAADARFSDSDSIIISSPVQSPMELRYGWQSCPKPPLKLFNSEKLPLGPFLMQIDQKSNRMTGD